MIKDFDKINKSNKKPQAPKTLVNTGISGGGGLKGLALAALAGCALIAPAQGSLASEITLLSGDIKTFPVDLQNANTSSDEKTNFTLSDVRLDSDEGAPVGYAAPLDSGLYTLTPATAEDYDYKTDTINADGTVTTNYYKITLNPENAGTAENITWSQTDTPGANTIAVTLPNDEVVYMQYSYAAPAGYTTTGTRVTSPSASNSTKMVFSGISNSVSGSGSSRSGGSDSDYGTEGLSKTGPNYNQSNNNGDMWGTSSSVTAYADASASASASANYSSTNKGGAMSNTSTSAVDITADFVDNSVSQTASGGSASGGTARAYGGTSFAYGGHVSATASYSTTDGSNPDNDASCSTSAAASADASASANASASGTAYAYGGAISNQSGAKLGNINGNFTGNSSVAKGNGGYASGGDARAYGGEATAVGGSASASASATSTKTGTYWEMFRVDARAYATASSSASATATASASATATADGYAYSYGGAISNEGTIGNITGDFANNYASAIASGGSTSRGYVYAFRRYL
nr:MAG TPA: hypothetical protein [Caudoviricetes sp.]